MSRGLKSALTGPLQWFLRRVNGAREAAQKLTAHASLASRIGLPLPASVVILGRPHVMGTGKIEIGEGCYLYPDLTLETRDDAVLRIGERVVINRGVHLVAMAGITIGKGTMIGEYASIRDANHRRVVGVPLRDSGYDARPIVLGDEVWIGRGATILPGVTIGSGATVGANAVVTRDVAPGAVVVGVPAKPIERK